jgi:hypothetical protein
MGTSLHHPKDLEMVDLADLVREVLALELVLDHRDRRSHDS